MIFEVESNMPYKDKPSNIVGYFFKPKEKPSNIVRYFLQLFFLFSYEPCIPVFSNLTFVNSTLYLQIRWRLLLKIATNRNKKQNAKELYVRRNTTHVYDNHLTVLLLTGIAVIRQPSFAHIFQQHSSKTSQR